MKERLQQNVHDIVFSAIEKGAESKSMIIYDKNSALSSKVADAYILELPKARAINFEVATPEEIFAGIDELSPGDLVVLIQSTSFRLNKFRFRLELFNRGMAVIEHPHLDRMPESEHETYIDALAYDKDYYRTVGPKLKTLIDKASKIVVSCDSAELVYDCPFEDAKLNIGDYREMKNTGGQFPIGEVFTEPVDFAKLNGTVKLYAYGNEKSRVVVPDEPVMVVIKEGVIVDTPGAPESFTSIMDKIKEDEELWVRELGLGMNRAMTRNRILNDVGSYERMCGIHLSIGKKHTIYKKDGFPKRSSKYHVDVFVDVTEVTIDGVVVYEGGRYVV